MNKVIIFQNYYREDTFKHLDSRLIPHFNTTTDKYFCCTVLRHLLERKHHLNSDYFGLLSWKIDIKTGRPGWWIKQYVENAHDGKDFYFPHWAHGWDSVWTQGEQSHPGIIGRAEIVLSCAGFPGLQLGKMKTGLYFSNFGIVKSEKYEEYMTRMLRPCMNVMDDPRHQPLYDRLYDEAPYSSYPPVSRERLLKATGGRPNYTFHSFIAERLFATYVALCGWTCGDIPRLR